jgi:uncharacterized protein (TIGR00106 family)
MIIAELAIFPTSEGPSVSRYVRRVLAALDETGLTHETGAMSTVIEAESLDEILAAVKKAHETLIDMDVSRIHIDLRVDHRRDKDISIAYKKEAVR